MYVEENFSSYQVMEWQAYFNNLAAEQAERDQAQRKKQSQPVSKVDQKRKAMGDKSKDQQQAEFDAEFNEAGVLSNR